MEIKIGVEELQEIFGVLSNVVRGNDDDVTSMVMMYTKNDKINFRASNISTTVEINARGGEIIKPGKVLFKLQDIKGYIGKFIPLIEDYGTEWFHFVIEDVSGFLKTKTLFKENKPAYRKLKFSTYNYDMPSNLKEFPEPQFILNSTILKMGINKVLYCVNPQDFRKALSGVKITLQQDKIIFAGTDGVKLSEFIVDINTSVEEKSYIFRYDLAYILKSILPDDSQVFINIDSNRMYVKSNNLYIIGGLILDETYPDYRSMFDLENVIRIPTEDFYDSIRVTTDVLESEDNFRLSLKMSDNILKIRSKWIESEEEFKENFGSVLDIDINGVLLESVLRGIRGENLDIMFTSDANYIVMRSVEYPNQTALLTTLKRR